MTLYDLKSYGLVSPDVTNPKTGELFSDDMIIKITGELNKYGTTNVVYEIDAGNIKDCESVYPKICTLVDDADRNGIVSIGDKYQCKVKNYMETGFENGYYFYVLSFNDDATTNLIMERNICEDGTVATAENRCLVDWISKDDYEKISGLTWDVESSDTIYGPVTAMNYLNTATSSWSYISNLNITYNDEGGNFINFKVTGKARLPYLNEVKAVGCEENSELSCPIWMVDYLNNYREYQKNPIDSIFGYMTFSSSDKVFGAAWHISYFGEVFDGSRDISPYNGVRPVITIPNFNMS